jgi:hypothetical protein
MPDVVLAPVRCRRISACADQRMGGDDPPSGAVGIAIAIGIGIEINPDPNSAP